MPMITVTLFDARATRRGLRPQIAAAVTDLAASILRKDPKVTAVIVDSRRRRRLVRRRRVAGRAEARQLLARHPRHRRHQHQGREGRLHRRGVPADGRTARAAASRRATSHVNDVRADAYGFGGLTQERRYIARQARRGAAKRGGLTIDAVDVPAGVGLAAARTPPRTPPRSATSTSSIVTGRPRSTRLVTP